MRTVFLAIFLLFFTPSFAQIQKGVLDLRNWDFLSNPIVELKGEWQFYWQKQVFPKQKFPEDFIYVQVPSDWRKFDVNASKLDSYGFATYRLQILLPENCPELAFRFEPVGSAATYFLNSKIIHQQGEVSTKRTRSLVKSTAVVLAAPAKQLDLLVHVSNFSDFYPAIWTSPKIGTAHYLLKEERKNMILEAFLAGSIFIMGLYHLGLFWKRRKDKSALYFGIFCIWIAIRTLVRGEILAEKLFYWDYYTIMHIDYLSFYIAVPSLLLFFNVLFPDEISQKFVKVTLIISLFFSFFVLFMPLYVFAQSLNYFQAFTILAGFYAIIGIFKAVIHKRPYALLLFFGVLLLFLSTILDILYANGVIDIGNFISLGLFIFIFVQAFLLSVRFSKSFVLAETLGNKLEEQNKQLEQLISQKTHDLTLANATLESQNTEIAVKANELNAQNRALNELLSELKVAQEQLVESEKMASLGQLTAGIVHEINNPINFISAGTESVKSMYNELKELLELYEKIDLSQSGYEKQIQKLKKEIHYTELLQDLDDMLHDVQFGVQRTTEIIKSIRTFSRTDNKELSLINIHENLNGALIILKSQYKHHIDIVKNYDENLAQIYCFAGKLNQVFVNLLANAIQAIPEEVHGVITISSQNITQTHRNDWQLDTNYEGIIVQIEDTGTGIKAENLEKIFQRNFTTKTAEKGTGLGLAISKEIIESHNGFIRVRSQVGVGTTFTLILPINLI